MVLSTSKSESMGLEIKKWRWESFFSLLYLIVSSIFAVSYFVIDILPQTYSPHNWLWGNFAIRDKITSWQSGLTHAKQKYEWWWILILKQITTDEKEAEGLQGTELNPQIPWNFRMFIDRHVTVGQEETAAQKAFTLWHKTHLQIYIPGFGNQYLS